MSKRKDSAIVLDMKEAADRITSYTMNMEYEHFLKDSKTQDAARRNTKAIAFSRRNVGFVIRGD